jgi:glucose-6-phosphate isomerase
MSCKEKILKELDEAGETSSHDASTSGLINAFKKKSSL